MLLRSLLEETPKADLQTYYLFWLPGSAMVSERDKLVHMEDNLRMRVIGQDEAIVAVSNAVRRSRAGLGEESRPVGSFLFLGPTGVGKTYLVKKVAEFLFA